MHYQGPTASDIANIQALNQSYLQSVERTLKGDPSSGWRRLGTLPFLLFSLREHDRDYWNRVLTVDRQADLLEVKASESRLKLQAAALGFLWQLSRQNPYAARLATGAPPGWCERLAATTLVELLLRAASRDDLIVPRFTNDDRLMQRLLRGDGSGTRQMQRMSRNLALQTLLTGQRWGRYRRLPAAACNMRSSTRRVVDRSDRRKV